MRIVAVLMDHLRAISLAVDIIGGQTATARHFDLKSYQVVQGWLARGTPKEWAPEIERACNGAITAERLCPHVKWVRVKDVNWPHRSGRPCADFAAEPA